MYPRDQGINEITHSRGVAKWTWNLSGSWLIDNQTHKRQQKYINNQKKLAPVRKRCAEKLKPRPIRMCQWLHTTTVHHTAQNSSNNLPSHPSHTGHVWLLVAVLRDSLLGLSLLSCATACCVVEWFDLTIIKTALSFFISFSSARQSTLYR